MVVLSMEGIGILIVCTLLFFILPSLYFAYKLAYPKISSLTPSPKSLGLEFYEKKISYDESGIDAWYFPADSDFITVLIPGFGIDKTYLIKLIKPLHEAKINLLVTDFQLQSNINTKTLCTFGLNESAIILNIIRWIKSQNNFKNKKISIVSFSIGASAAFIASTKNETIDALIMDSAIYDVKAILKVALQRMFGMIGFLFFPITMYFFKLFIKHDPNEINLMNYVSFSKAKKVLVIHSKKDTVSYWRLAEEFFKKILIKKEIWLTESDHTQTFFDLPSGYVSRVCAIIKDCENKGDVDEVIKK